MDYTNPADLIAHIGTSEDNKVRRAILSRYRPISGAIAAEYARIYKAQGLCVAQAWIIRIDSELFLGDEKKRLYACAPDSELKQWCELRAHECQRSFNDDLGANVDDPELAMMNAREFVEKQGLKWPLKLKRNMSEKEYQLAWIQAAARAQDAKWWRKQARTVLGRKREAVAREVRLVSAEKGLYCSNVQLASRKRQAQRNRELLEALEAENQDGQVFTLDQLAECGLGNPRNRFAEMITRSKGNDLIAKELGFEGWMITLTTPSRFHRMRKGNNQCFAVKGWDKERLTPKDAQDYLQELWECIRAEFSRESVRFFGFRVVEPHHDGTPHWHMSIYCLPEDLDFVKNTIRDYALNDSPDEKGAQDKRCDAFRIDFEKGGATAYLVKYLTKNIAGCEGMEKELDLETEGQQEMYVTETQARVEAWAACWGIRQFQFFGCPPVTVWRELRRAGFKNPAIKESLAGDMSPEDKKQFEEIRAAAVASDWKEFVMLMGGPALPRSQYPLQSWREPNEEINGYYELADKLKGVVLSGVETLKHVLTKFMEWTISPVKKRADDFEQVRERVTWFGQRAQAQESKRANYENWWLVNSQAQPDALRNAGTAFPWTRVNNCTGAIVPGAG